MRLLLAALFCLSAVPSFADLNDDFRNTVRSEYLKPFALDLGGVLGASTVDPGGSLGFPGVEAGIVTGVQFRPDRDDRVLRDSGVKSFGVPLVQAAVGLPLGFSVVGRGISGAGLRVLGGGLRYSVFKPGLVTKFLPSVGVSFFADSVGASEFKATHYAANVSAGLGLPFITPFAALGYDMTKIEVRGNVPALVQGQSAWARGGRLALGADLTPFPFLRLRTAYQLLHGIPGMTADLLFKF